MGVTLRSYQQDIYNKTRQALRDGYKVPDMIVSSEYLNFNNEKASKGKGNAIAAIDMAEKYDILCIIKQYFV